MAIENVELYRAQLSCAVGRNALDGSGEIPDGLTSTQWALFNLLHAVEDIAKHLEKQAVEED